MKKFKKYLIYTVVLGILAFVLLVGALFFAMTNSGCITGLILPLASSFSGINIAAEQVNFAPLDSRINIKGLTVGPKTAPFMNAGELKVSYHLWDIKNGRINIDEFSLSDSTIRIMKDKNGNSNIPGATASSDSQVREEERKNAQETSFVKSFNAKNINIHNLNFYFEQANPNGTVTKAAAEKLEVNLPLLKNGEEIKLTVKGNIAAGSGDSISIRNALLDVKLNMLLDNENMPSKIDLVSRINRISGNIDRFEMNNQEFALDVNIAKEKGIYHINKFSFNETAGAETLSAISVSGSASQEPFMFDLNVDVPRISPQIIEFAQGMTGSNYKCSNANVRYKGKLLCSGGVYMANGDMSISNVTVKNVETSAKSANPMELLLRHDISVNMAKQEADLKSISLEISENKVKTIEAVLANPSIISWKKNNMDVADFQPKFRIRFRNFDLQLVNVFMPEKAQFNITAGKLNGEIGADLRLAQKTNILTGEILISKLGVKSPSYTNSGIDISEKFNVQIKDNTQISLKTFDTTVRYADKAAAAVNIKADMDLKDLSGKAEVLIPFINENIAKLLPASVSPDTKNMIDRLAPFTLAMKNETAFNFKENSLTVNSFSADFFSGKNKALALALSEPSRISLKNGFDLPIMKATLLCNSELAFLNAFMTDENGCKFHSGKINSNIRITGKNNFSIINTAGTVNLENANFQTSPTDKYTAVDLTENFQVELSSFEKLKILACEAEASYQKKKALKVETAGELNFAENSGNINIAVKYLNANAFQMIPQLKEKLSVKSIDANAETVLAYNAKSGYTMLTGDINIANLQNDKIPQPVKSSISVNFIKTQDRIELKKFICKVNDKTNLLADLKMTANIFMKPGQGKSTASLTSEKIDLAAIEAFFNDKKSDAAAAPAPKVAEAKKKVPAKPKTTEPEKEPEAIEALKGIDLASNIDLKNVTYGQDLILECKSQINIKNSILSIPKFQLLVNQIPLNAEGEIDLGKSDGYPYYFKANFNNLYLPPLIKAFVKNTYSKTQGNISSFSTAFSGKGFTTPNVMKSFKGFLNVEFQDISIPNEMKDNAYVGLLFITLDSFSKVAKSLPDLKDPSKLINSLDFTKQTLNNPATIDFATGEIRVAAEKGKANIQKCYFKGTQVDYFSMNGNIFLDRRLDLSTETSLKTLILPMKIGGTLDEPEVDMKDFMGGFVEKNAVNILSGEGLGETLKSGMEELFKNSDKLLKLKK